MMQWTATAALSWNEENIWDSNIWWLTYGYSKTLLCINVSVLCLLSYWKITAHKNVYSGTARQPLWYINPHSFSPCLPPFSWADIWVMPKINESLYLQSLFTAGRNLQHSSAKTDCKHENHLQWIRCYASVKFPCTVMTKTFPLL